MESSIHNLKSGKSCGHDGVSAEHFKYAHKSISVYLAMLFTSMLSHGYLPDAFMKTILLPLVKNQSGDMSDGNNYRPTALVSINQYSISFYLST